METHLMNLLMLVFLAITCNWAPTLVASSSKLDDNLALKKQLHLINKNAILSFVTKQGDILDCIAIDKQLAFDHPLLKNHSIQIKPTFKIQKRPTVQKIGSSILLASQLVPKNMRCPKGTVLVKRIQEQDLAMEKFKPLLTNTLSSFNSSNFVYPNDAQSPQVHNEVAALVTATQNTGAAGIINLWSPQVKPDQFSDACIFVANDDASNTNVVMTGWTVNPYLYPNSTRLFAYWTVFTRAVHGSPENHRDSGKSSGCFNTLCPGFVQISKQVTLGQILSPTSSHGISGHQYFVDLTIQQDVNSKNWWVLYGKENVGYWPKELFSTLKNGASRAGWGGEIQSPITQSSPEMGGGHFPDEGYRQACLIKYLQLHTPQGFPDQKQLQMYLTKPKCYGVVYDTYPTTNQEGVPEGDWGHYIFFGGPSDCKF